MILFLVLACTKITLFLVLACTKTIDSKVIPKQLIIQKKRMQERVVVPKKLIIPKNKKNLLSKKSKKKKKKRWLTIFPLSSPSKCLLITSKEIICNMISHFPLGLVKENI